MTIYFAGSIRGGRTDAPLYADLIEFLRGFGEVLTEHVGDPSLSEKGDDGPNDRYIHDRDMAWLSACDVIIAEVTIPSLGVGYELGRAISMGKPILCLHRPNPDRPVSAMIAGSEDMTTAPYTSLEEAKAVIERFMALIHSREGDRK